MSMADGMMMRSLVNFPGGLELHIGVSFEFIVLWLLDILPGRLIAAEAGLTESALMRTTVLRRDLSNVRRTNCRCGSQR